MAGARFAEDVRGDDLALVFADVGQQPDAVDVTDRPQPLAGAQVRVDRDSVAAGDDADRFQTDPFDSRAPAGCDEQAVAVQLTTVIELQDIVLADTSRRGRVYAEDELDPVTAQGLAERLAQRRRLASKDAVGALDQSHLAAQATDDLRQLDAGRATAQHEQPARDHLHARRLARAPDAIELPQPRDGRDDRVGASSDDDVLGAVAHAVDFDGPGPGEPAAAAQQRDPPGIQPALLPGVGVAGDHEVAPRQRRLDVHLRARPHLARGVHRLAGAQQRLGRDAGPVRALAADQLALDDRDPQTTLGQRAGAVLTRRAATQNDHVVVIAHVKAVHHKLPGNRVLATLSRTVARIGHRIT